MYVYTKHLLEQNQYNNNIIQQRDNNFIFHKHDSEHPSTQHKELVNQCIQSIKKYCE